MMAADRRLGRLYGRLSSKEAVALILGHLAKGNKVEVHKAIKALPRVTVTMRDPETVQRFAHVRFGYTYWALAHWRNMVAFVSAMMSAESAVARNDEPAAEAACAALATAQARLLALDAILLTFSERTGLSAEALEVLTETPTFATFTSQVSPPPMLAEGPDTEYQAAIEEVVLAGL